MIQSDLELSHVLSDEREAYDAWSRQVDRLNGDQPAQTDPRVADYYRHAAEVAP